jgi:hypothetical protein
MQRAVLLAGQPHIDRPALTAFLGQLEYPATNSLLAVCIDD